MGLSQTNAHILLVNINKLISNYANATIEQIFNNDLDLTFPPNTELNDLEKAELKELNNYAHLKNALKKILTDNSAGVMFGLMNLIDGTTDPEVMAEDWTGVQFSDIDHDNDREAFEDMLHDSLYEKYWNWKAVEEQDS
ncbi:hypothetical protein [Mucilaginibacter myungsuensis]|uniref:Uncharacterized protein n=1 Tax=Mucilaginibacter myungsuensis TaxID=649104 RepID=A0A929L1J1_9SPHI|nr:hypothetical protein [Mucilaginibacter myungsuensis]MBE9662789.1 hypothetical protein [Mucilaginibacter myungsuensis]MDN3598209.1 hypothetical protein [Mucilaginibacter myungsuensis]